MKRYDTVCTVPVTLNGLSNPTLVRCNLVHFVVISSKRRPIEKGKERFFRVHRVRPFQGPRGKDFAAGP